MSRIISIKNPKSPIAEAYRGIRTSIEFSNLDKNLQVITVTSSMQNEGKSTVLANLAVSFANLDKKVLIMEGDLRNPSVHRMFNISNIKGVTDILLQSKVFADCVHCTDVKNLHVLTCGAIPPNPSEMLSSKKILEKVGANILGVVLNKFEASGASGYYNYYYEQETKARGRRKK